MSAANRSLPHAGATDDRPTLAALGVLAFALTDVCHEALGHGLATLAVGGKAVLLTTCFFQSAGTYSRWIPAAGGLANLAVGGAALALLRLRSTLTPGLRLFLVLVAAFNLFFAFGYPAYSGIAQFGDWAAVIAGLGPAWCFRTTLVVVSIAGYYGTVRLLVRPLTPFAAYREGAGGHTGQARLHRITFIPFAAALALSVLAGALNPEGWRTMLTSGLPAAAAAFGLTQMHHLVSSAPSTISVQAIPSLRRSLPWIGAAIAVFLGFVGVLGPGIHFS